jgi:hypothetical protein
MRIVVCTLALALPLGGCAARAPRDLDVDAKAFTLPSNKARIYVYRNQGFPKGPASAIIVDGGKVGVMAAGDYVCADVETGPHVVSVIHEEKHPTSASLRLEAAATTAYFVRYWDSWNPFDAPHVKLMSDADGRRGVLECRLAGIRYPDGRACR